MDEKNKLKKKNCLLIEKCQKILKIYVAFNKL